MKINRRWLVVSIALLLVLTGCHKEPEAKPLAPPQQNAKAKPPENAETMLEEIDKILTGLDAKARQEKVPQMAEAQPEPTEKQPEQAAQQEDSSSQQGGETNQADQQQSEKADQSQQTKQPEPKPEPAQDWQPETISLVKIHENWNALEPKVIKAGMPTEDLKGFESALGDLTLALDQKKLAAALPAANKLYREFGRVMSYFDYPLPQDYFQVRYEVMGALTETYKGDWTAASRHMTEIEEPWARLQTQLDKKHKEDADRTSYAIKDLTLAVKQKAVGLTYIKGKIALSNLKSLEKKITKMQ